MAGPTYRQRPTADDATAGPSSAYAADNRSPRLQAAASSRGRRPTSAAAEQPDPVATQMVQAAAEAMRAEVDVDVAAQRREQLMQLMPSIVPRGWQPVLVPTAVVYKTVAAVGDRLLSIFDGKTEYDLGHTLLARRGGAAAWPPLDCCYFVHPTHEQALTCELPAASKCKHEARVLLLVRAGGKGYVHERNGAVAVSHVTPLRILGMQYFVK